MQTRSKVLLLATVLPFILLTWIAPSSAQRSPQRSAPRSAGAKPPRPAGRAARPLRPQKSGDPLVPVFAQAVEFAESKPVRELPAATNIVSSGKPGPPEVEPREVNELNTEEGRRELPGIKSSVDGALQTSLRPRNETQVVQPNVLPTPSLTFDGVSAADEGNSVAPPDTNGDIGPNHYVQAVNNRVGIFDKNGNLLVPFFTQSSLFAPLGGLASQVDRGDPIVLYDRMADRWLISQFAFTALNAPPYHEAIAISKTGDPTGGYYLYDFVLPGNEFPDYPKFGVWPDGYYMTTNQFTNGGPFNGGGAFAFDRAKMLVGDPTAGLIYFSLNLTFEPNGIFGMLPADQDGLLPPPAGAPNVFLYFIAGEFGDAAGDGLRLFDFHADFTTPASSTFLERSESPMALAAFDPRNPNGRGDIEQPPPAGNNATDRLDSLSSDTMFRLQYFNRNGTESLVSNFTVNVSGVAPTNAANYQAGFRYFELRKASPATPYAVVEQATFAPAPISGATGTNRWMGSAAIDNQENLAVAYSASSTTINPSLNFAGRAFNDPPNGLFQGEATLFAGPGVQRVTGNRWGDYSALTIDPADDCTFWFTSEYYTTNNAQFNWRTRIGRFKFSTCTAPAQGTLNGTVTACDTGQPLQFALVTVSGGPSDGYSGATAANGSYSMKLAPGTYSVNFSAVGHDCNPAGPLTAVVTDGGTVTLNQCLSGDAKYLFQSATISGGNGNGKIERNECNNLSVAIKNDGCLIGSNVSATISSPTAGVSITQPNSPYPNAGEGATTSNTVPFSISTSPSFVCGTAITINMTVNFTGGSSTFSFTLPSCQCEPISATGALVPGTDGLAVSRLGRNAVSSVCGTAKACPGPIDAVQRLFRTHSFTNGPTAACATITTTTTCPLATNQIIPVAYLNSFVPSNLCTNYLGDPGGSNPTVTFQVNVPANATLVVSVQEVNANQGGCSSYTVTVSGLVCDVDAGAACTPCTITCPANVSVSNDANQCGAVVNYPAPTSTGTCGTTGCVPAAGSFFPKGTTTVTCSTTAGPTCSFTVTVNDTQPPSITCPGNITATTTLACPVSTSQTVSFASPTAADNCPGVTAACVPASGSSFPAGVTTVTCTATDASGNTATCSFAVTVFNICLQDDSNPAVTLLIDTVNKTYQFKCGATVYSGKGTITQSGCTFSLDHTAPDRRVRATFSTSTKSGNASVQSPPGTTRCTITDRNMGNNNCVAPL
jgi:hypothetical protein